MKLPSLRARSFLRLATPVTCAVVLGGSAVATAADTPFARRDVTIQGQGAEQRAFRPIQKGIALERFRLDFAHTYDTPMTDIGIELTGNQIRGWFNGDTEAPMTLFGQWRELSKSPKVEHRRITATCRAKRCRVGTVAQGGDSIPLLAGFTFHNLAGGQKVERMAIYPERRKGPNANVAYFARFETDGATRYTVDIDLFLVDPSVVTGEYTNDARSQPGKPFAHVPLEWKNGLLALQGFDVKFANGAHHLQEFAVEPVQGNNSVNAVYFSDKNDDDPFDARLWWADLTAPGIKVIPMDKPLPQNTPQNPGPAPQLDPVTPQPKPTVPNIPNKKLPGPAPTPKF